MERSKLALARLRKHWTLAQAAEYIGCDGNTLNRWELGKTAPRGYNAQRLCEVYESTPAELGLDLPHAKVGRPRTPSILDLPGAGKTLYSETLDVAEAFIKQTLTMRRIASLPEVEQSANGLHKLFVYFLANTPPQSHLESRFLSIYAQEQNIHGLMYFENKQYDQALKTFEAMYQTAHQLDDPVLQIHALQKMGVELNRANKKAEAEDALERARDLSFRGSKHVAAFSNAYLAHIYAATGDARHFERAIDTALMLADPLKDSYGDGTDFVFHKFSGILQLKSRGFLRIGEPKKALALHDELKRQISHDANLWLDFRLHLYRARAYLMLGEVDSCIEAAREFFRDVQDWQSPHRTSRGFELLEEIDAAGYSGIKPVREFREELLAATKRQTTN